MLDYPRMLFKGDETRVVANADEKAAALADGWNARWIPSDGPRPEPAVAPSDPPTEPVKRGPGRPRKE